MSKLTHVRLDRENIQQIDDLEMMGPVTNLYLQQVRRELMPEFSCHCSCYFPMCHTHCCGIRLGRQAVGLACCVMPLKNPALLSKREGDRPVFLAGLYLMLRFLPKFWGLAPGLLCYSRY